MISRLVNPKMVRSFRRYLVLRIYVLQAGIATVALMVALWTADLFSGTDGARAVLIAAIGSTAFVLFISPHGRAAQPWRVIGGHAVAFGVAVPFAFFADGIAGGSTMTNISLLFGFYAALAVGLAMLAMAVTNTEHPPAAGTALAVVGYGLHWELAVFTLTAVLVLIGVHRVLRDRMRDLD